MNGTGVNVQETHFFPAEELQRWATEHGLEVSQIRDITIRIGWTDVGVGAWADVTWYKRNYKGHRYFDAEARDAATGFVTVPLRTLPQLVPVPLR